VLTLWQHKIKIANVATGNWMHVISKRLFSEAARNHPSHRTSLEGVYRMLRKGSFAAPEEMKRVFPSLDNFRYKSKWWVINIAGNHLRLIAFIQFSHNRMYVKHILAHADYDKLSRRYMKGEFK
jgi:mRNA interferase HigB